MTSSAVKNRRRHGIDRTRGQFDDILEELTHRIDVPARVRDKVHDVEETVRVKAQEVKQQVPEIAETLEVAEILEVAETLEVADTLEVAEILEVAETLEVAAEEATWQIEELADELPEENFPQVAAHVALEPVTARQRLPIAAIAVAVLLVLLVLRRLVRRNS
ncbi:MAG TPA: DUF3618 domain-containing protein [Pseudonocardiaceae bacterium]|nr:DUF3618 domain-containing protein [Pseudonocardiaceae bacterium]